MISRNAPRLIVIDMQQIFRDSSSEWAVEGYDAAERQIARLVESAAEGVIWTKFVRDPAEEGSWRAYYDRWATCRESAESPVWELTSRVREGDAVLTLPTFSKWGEGLAALTADDERLLIAGVATDCCVLSTVLGTVDAGKFVTVVSDACAGVTTEAHEQTLQILGLLSPMVTVTTTDRLLKEETRV